ncbi:MAG TPA: isoprenylcysteine carboxylmethyltransferase family protein, partial [Caulobacteraceae bacterium]|nr:isoprenylcysteine carboxylmethyltransferase family protein [Caulobacteraceae bacterium]
ATFGVEDWIYLSQHILVLGISLWRRDPVVLDQSWPTATAVIVSYAYPYAQVAYLNWSVGHVAWSGGGIALVIFSALLSLAALLSIGRLFGVRPALRGIATIVPYRLVRHPMYLAYVIGDIGYLLEEWNAGLVIIVAAGWASLAYRIHAEEQVLSAHPGWPAYVGRTPYRLAPGLW